MSLEFNGFLRYSEAMPYDHRKIAVVTNYKVEFVEKALNIFVELGVVEMLDDGTLYFTKLVDCVGSETEWAEKKRVYRSKEDNVLGVSSNCPTDIDKDINSNSEIESDKGVQTQSEKFSGTNPNNAQHRNHGEWL